MKRIMQLVLLLISISPLFALSPSEEETRLAISCVNDAVFVAANYFISDIKPENPNIILRTPKNSETSDAVVFNNLDMSSLLFYFPSKELDSTNVVSSLKEPLAPYVRDVLLASDWQENQATILGAMAIAFKDNSSVAQVVSNLVQGIYPRMGLVTDITVRGDLFSQDINIKGVFILEENMGELVVVPLQITINGDEFDVYSL